MATNLGLGHCVVCVRTGSVLKFKEWRVHLWFREKIWRKKNETPITKKLLRLTGWTEMTVSERKAWTLFDGNWFKGVMAEHLILCASKSRHMTKQNKKHTYLCSSSKGWGLRSDRLLGIFLGQTSYFQKPRGTFLQIENLLRSGATRIYIYVTTHTQTTNQSNHTIT